MNSYESKKKIRYNIINEKTSWSRRLKKIEMIINQILKNPGYFIDKKITMLNIDFLLTDNKKIKELNKKYRNMNKSTDVLTFSSTQIINRNLLYQYCDIVLSIETIKKDCLKLKIDFYHHLTHLIIHALLHNNGYNHNTESNSLKMKNLEVLILKKLGIRNPYN